MDFKLQSNYKPTGDQPQAIRQLVEGIRAGDRAQVLLGVTGSGKTFTMANVIAQVNRPTLVLTHNKTLTAQLYGELQSFFPDNAVEYFVSYYDYYQPEAYISVTDTYIEKDLQINELVDKLRLKATSGPPRHYYRGLGVLHLRYGQPGRLQIRDYPHFSGYETVQNELPVQPDRQPVFPNGDGLFPRHFSRARRHGGYQPALRRLGVPRHFLGRRD
jgi:hypothetical protein